MTPQMVLILPGRKYPVKTHALDCKWAADYPPREGGNYVKVPASSIDPKVGRCRVCGGGR